MKVDTKKECDGTTYEIRPENKKDEKLLMACQPPTFLKDLNPKIGLMCIHVKGETK